MKTITILQTETEIKEAFKKAEYNNPDLLKQKGRVEVELVAEVYVLTGGKLKYLGLCPKCKDILAVIEKSRFQFFKIEFVSKVWTTGTDVENRDVETFIVDKKNLLDLV